ncbi:metal ABC transporter substrate-binding protein [Cohnella nanjingensis]|uniref:Zinc ABC transporter substrate-binding protein n=1 Tax=Cohnella nanjingensis TaxID=1387779 RepID=A0A7X0RX39_9BACL|nr:metal ABC transporter substrate-binding protein [Cohnella nanjingensis]MBB6675287.1 zinc ABC transporter substrate-binding protein [Cohnella nanjingensis]
MRTKHLTLTAAVAALALLLSGCGGTSGGTAQTGNPASPVSGASEGASAPTAAGGKKLQAVASFYPMYEFSKQVAGDRADVTLLIPAGTEPHDWEPSAKDMVRLSEADVFVYNGLVEGWAEQALESAANGKRVAVKASDGIALQEGLADEEEEGGHAHDASADGHAQDPHVWLDPVLAQREVTNIAAAFAEADPDHKADYQANADAYIAKLKALDRDYREGLKDAKRKDFVTQHAAFGYLAKQYGLTQVPIAGLSPEQEPAPDRMAEVVKTVRAQQIRTIFFETLVDPKIAQTIADETGAKTAVLNPLEGLTDDERKQGLDYIAVMESNLAALRQALNE